MSITESVMRNVKLKGGLLDFNDDTREFTVIVTSEVVDSQGEIVDWESIQAVLPKIKERGYAVNYAHFGVYVGHSVDIWESTFADVMNDYPETVSTLSKYKPDTRCLVGKNKIHKGAEIDDIAWEELKSGKINGVSFGGTFKELNKISCDGLTCGKVITTDRALFELALTGEGIGTNGIGIPSERPANPTSIILALKSMKPTPTKTKAKRRLKKLTTKADMECPKPTQDLELNTRNRDRAIKKFNYGALNPDEPGDYWKDIAVFWDTTEEIAKKSLCGNCVAFDVSPRMKDCITGDTFDEDGELGYCWMHNFKCHSARTCHTWAKGGAIEKDEESYEWQKQSDPKTKSDPCWDGYEQRGMKRGKGGKLVPNCIPKPKTKTDEWWNKMTPSQQKDYIKKHPRSKYANQVGGSEKDKESKKPRGYGYPGDRSTKDPRKSAMTEVLENMDKADPRWEETINKPKYNNKQLRKTLENMGVDVDKLIERNRIPERVPSYLPLDSYRIGRPLIMQNFNDYSPHEDKPWDDYGGSFITNWKQFDNKVRELRKEGKWNGMMFDGIRWGKDFNPDDPNSYDLQEIEDRYQHNKMFKLQNEEVTNKWGDDGFSPIDAQDEFDAGYRYKYNAYEDTYEMYKPKDRKDYEDNLQYSPKNEEIIKFAPDWQNIEDEMEKNPSFSRSVRAFLTSDAGKNKISKQALPFYLDRLDKWEDREKLKSKAKKKNDPKTPAKPSERRSGSKKNPKGSASGQRGDIKLSESQIKSIKTIIDKHNEKVKKKNLSDWKKVTLGQAKAVVRRGMGAFSTSHRPNVSSRTQWGLGRLNAFIYLLEKGKPKNAKYTTDNDLLPKEHKRSTKKAKADDTVTTSTPNFHFPTYGGSRLSPRDEKRRKDLEEEMAKLKSGFAELYLRDALNLKQSSNKSEVNLNTQSNNTIKVKMYSSTTQDGNPPSRDDYHQAKTMEMMVALMERLNSLEKRVDVQPKEEEQPVEEVVEVPQSIPEPRNEEDDVLDLLDSMGSEKTKAISEDLDTSNANDKENMKVHHDEQESEEITTKMLYQKMMELEEKMDSYGLTSKGSMIHSGDGDTEVNEDDLKSKGDYEDEEEEMAKAYSDEEEEEAMKGYQSYRKAEDEEEEEDVDLKAEHEDEDEEEVVKSKSGCGCNKFTTKSEVQKMIATELSNKGKSVETPITKVDGQLKTKSDEDKGVTLGDIVARASQERNFAPDMNTLIEYIKQ